MSSDAKSFQEIEQDSTLMKTLKQKVKDEKNFVFLDAFTSEKWSEEEFYTEHVVFPADWKKSNVHDGIQTKVM